MWWYDNSCLRCSQVCLLCCAILVSVCCMWWYDNSCLHCSQMRYTDILFTEQEVSVVIWPISNYAFCNLSPVTNSVRYGDIVINCFKCHRLHTDTYVIQSLRWDLFCILYFLIKFVVVVIFHVMLFHWFRYILARLLLHHYVDQVTSWYLYICHDAAYILHPKYIACLLTFYCCSTNKRHRVFKSVGLSLFYAFIGLRCCNTILHLLYVICVLSVLFSFNWGSGVFTLHVAVKMELK